MDFLDITGNKIKVGDYIKNYHTNDIYKVKGSIESMFDIFKGDLIDLEYKTPTGEIINVCYPSEELRHNYILVDKSEVPTEEAKIN